MLSEEHWKQNLSSDLCSPHYTEEFSSPRETQVVHVEQKQIRFFPSSHGEYFYPFIICL
jgi:hypothetical protein